jgi:hypothetical protein
MKRFFAKTPVFFQKVRNTALTILALSGLVGSLSDNAQVKEVCTGIMLVGASAGLTAQSAKEEN